MSKHPDLKNKKKKLKKKKAQLPFRLNILFIFVFIIFSLLIVQLGVVQILNGEEAQRQIDQTEDTASEKPVPRGKFYDSRQNLILDNKAVKSITYTPPKNGDSAKKLLDLAKDLSNYITIIKDEEELNKTIRERDKKEYWYLKNRDVIEERLTEEEKSLKSSELYQVELDHIKEEDLAEIDWTSDLLNVLAIKKELDQAMELSPHVVANEGITDKEYAQVAEHIYELPGIDAVIDWDRVANYDGTLSTFFGNVTGADQGIPRDNSEYYLNNGYTWNDRVGTSGLEEQYEHVLRGRKEKVEYTTDSNNNVINSEVLVEGQRGKDLILSVNMEYQAEVDKIVEDELRKAINNPASNNGYLKDALAVVMNPQTGDVLALSGIRHDKDTGEYSNQAYRTIYDAHEPGSSIKGATMLAGYQEGVINIGTHLSDQMLEIAGTEEISSHTFLGHSISDLTALERSSNVYMSRIALKISGATYRENEPLSNFDYDAYDTMRNYYSQFGLGVKTGIDLPFESTGQTGSDGDPGNLLYLSFGQYDTYTALQLGQYVSTIANDGYRMRPRLVKEIREPGNGEDLGKIVKSINPEVMNRVEMDDKYIERVQQGFRRVAVGSRGTARRYWSGFPYEMALKTGTAQKPQYEKINDELVKVADTDNLTLVGYSPLKEPEVAFAVIVPENGTGRNRRNIHHEIGKRIIKAYYDQKKETENKE